MTTALTTGTVLGAVSPLLWLLAVRAISATPPASRRARRGQVPQGHDARLDGEVVTSGDIARLLAPVFEPEMVRLVTHTARQHGLAESTLWDFSRMFGPVLMAVAVAANATEEELQAQLQEGAILHLQAYLLFASASGLAMDRSVFGANVGWGRNLTDRERALRQRHMSLRDPGSPRA